MIDGEQAIHVGPQKCAMHAISLHFVNPSTFLISFDDKVTIHGSGCRIPKNHVEFPCHKKNMFMALACHLGMCRNSVSTPKFRCFRREHIPIIPYLEMDDNWYPMTIWKPPMTDGPYFFYKQHFERHAEA